MTYKHILVAVDLSEKSQLLVNKAVSLARPHDAKISLIHVDVYYNTYYTGLVEANLGYTHETLSQETRVALKILADSANYPVSHILSDRGDLGEALTDVINKYDIDLVVCGHHKDFWSKLVSSARQLLNSVQTDLLIIPLKDEIDD